MAKSVPVSRERHSGKGWRHPAGYGFVAADTIAPSVGRNSPMRGGMPSAFIERSGRYSAGGAPGARQGEQRLRRAGRPMARRLCAGRVARLSVLPLRGEGSEQTFLCVDEDSGLIVDGDGENVENSSNRTARPRP